MFAIRDTCKIRNLICFLATSVDGSNHFANDSKTNYSRVLRTDDNVPGSRMIFEKDLPKQF